MRSADSCLPRPDSRRPHAVPIAFDEEHQQDEAAFNLEAKVRRTWKSAGVRPFGKDIKIMDPAMDDHGEAVNKLARKLGWVWLLWREF